MSQEVRKRATLEPGGWSVQPQRGECSLRLLHTDFIPGVTHGIWDLYISKLNMLKIQITVHPFCEPCSPWEPSFITNISPKVSLHFLDGWIMQTVPSAIVTSIACYIYVFPGEEARAMASAWRSEGVCRNQFFPHCKPQELNPVPQAFLLSHLTCL